MPWRGRRGEEEDTSIFLVINLLKICKIGAFFDFLSKNFQVSSHDCIALNTSIFRKNSTHGILFRP